MIKRSKQRSVKARNPIAKDLRNPQFHLRLKPSKKQYQRKPKHRGRPLATGSHGLLSGSGSPVLKRGIVPFKAPLKTAATHGPHS